MLIDIPTELRLIDATAQLRRSDHASFWRHDIPALLVNDRSIGGTGFVAADEKKLGGMAMYEKVLNRAKSLHNLYAINPSSIQQ